MSDFKNLIVSSNSFELAGESYKIEEWLSILFSRFSNLKYTNEWVNNGTFEGTDVRPMVLLRIESATIWYEQNVFASSELCERYVQNIIAHGYDKKFAINHLANLREVKNRIGYLDSVYFAIDYFISKMLEIHGVSHSGNNKVSDFAALLSHFSMETSGATTQEILSEIKLHLPSSMAAIHSILSERSSVMVPFKKSFEYLTLIRNSLHNNGFANKNMNNLVIGPFEYKKIVKNKSLECMGAPNLIVLILQMVNCIEQLCEQSVRQIPAPQNDPYMEHMKSQLGFYP
tara:strand:+ start:6054 stop:6914 length:861 start_codon:yes stop_codon:yes gene_type:complete